MLNKKIAIIGAGRMGAALIKGLLSAGVVVPGNIMASDNNKFKLKSLAGKGIRKTIDNIKAVEWADVIILSVKPKDIECVLEEIFSASKNKFFISIAAGIKTSLIEKRLGHVPVIRVMPNTPALVGEAMSAISPGRFAGPRDERIARIIFKSIGAVIKFPEKDMDAVTALSGSGPAYFFFLMEALVSAGKKLGLPARESLTLAVETASGSAILAKKSGIPPDKLREMVTSKGGTTEAAFKVLGSAGVKNAIIKAVIEAQKRSMELARG